MDLRESDRQKIIAWAKRHPEVRRIYLFGSRARNDSRSGSDVDLAIELFPMTEFAETFDVWQRLKADWHSSSESRLSAPADLQLCDDDSQIVRTSVEKEGIPVYDAGQSD